MNDRARTISRHLLTGVLALSGGVLVAALVGLLGGITARLLMRGFALALGHEPAAISLAGTSGIALVFAVAATPGSVAVALGARRVGVGLLVLGGLLLTAMGVAIGLQDGAGELAAGPAPAAGAALALAFVAVIVGQQVLAYRGARRVARRRGARGPGAAHPDVVAAAAAR